MRSRRRTMSRRSASWASPWQPGSASPMPLLRGRFHRPLDPLRHLPLGTKDMSDSRRKFRARLSGVAVSGFIAMPCAFAGDDLVFADGFDGRPPSLSTYDDLTEGSLDTSTVYNGVSYHDVNGIGGVFPDGSTFTPGDVGDQLIIEDSTDFYAVHPDYGSAPNSLTFGSVYIPGPNLSLGPLVRVTMDLDAPANTASVDIGYYENGPWGGIVIHLDAL